MPVFVIFIFASVVFGAGSMLAPALPTQGPRIGLAGALALAFVVSGSLFWAAAFGWNTLVIDYLWFAVIVGIFFLGTLSAGMFRAEAAGGTKEYSGWPGPTELAFFLMAMIVFAVPALVLPVPLDTDAQGFGYLALTLRLSGSLTTLAPFHPEVHYLYSPGFPALAAYLSTQLHAPLQNVEMALGAVLGVVFVWVAYDFGNEIDPHGTRRTGMIAAFCAMIGVGLLMANLDSHYTAQLGLVFALAFITFALRFHREGKRADFIAAAVTLAGVPLAQPDITIILILGYVPWLVTMWFARPRPTFRRWLGLSVGIPLLAVIGLAPWLAKILPLLTSDIKSPFGTDPKHLLVMVVYHGGVIVVLALIGLVIAARRRQPIDVLMIGWLVLVVDFSSLGITRTLFPWLPLFKYDYPFSIAWHGPIIPYLYLGTVGTWWLIDRLGRDRVEKWARRLSLPFINVVALAAVLIIAFGDPLSAASKKTPLKIFGAFSSRDDVEAMQWIAQNTTDDALILNHPGPQEGDWTPVIAQRNTVYFRPQPFYQNTEKVEAVQHDLLAFWENPSAAANAELLMRYKVKYIIVPQILNQPDILNSGVFRWRPPLTEYLTPVTETPFLHLVFQSNGAQVYQVVAVNAAR